MYRYLESMIIWFRNTNVIVDDKAGKKAMWIFCEN